MGFPRAGRNKGDFRPRAISLTLGPGERQLNDRAGGDHPPLVDKDFTKFKDVILWDANG
jgi:hypothetical protein